MLFSRAYRSWGKRFLDIIGASAGLVLFGPVLGIAALVVRIQMGTPVFFRQNRPGKGARPFTIYKLRTMTDSRDRQGMPKADSERLTGIGRFLRRTSLDELPEFLNVLKGEMSLVGPRPPIPSEVEKYDPWQRRRLSMKPGLTCLWQISGRNKVGFEEWMRLDLRYIDSWSLWLDVKILLRTIPVVVVGFGAK